jgi:hypothetical protein
MKMNDDIESLKDAEKEQLSFTDSDYLADQQIPTPKENNHWVGGFILITAGIVFLLTTVFGMSLHNWWALFILIPGCCKLVSAGQQYGRDGRFSHQVRGDLTWGLILILVASTFIFGLHWGAIWPIFLIIFGIGALLSGLLDH